MKISKCLSLSLLIILIASHNLQATFAQQVAPEIMWDKTFGGSGNDKGYWISSAPDGGFAIVGTTSDAWTGEEYLWVSKLDASGNPLWVQTLGEGKLNEAQMIVPTPDGGYAVAGYIDTKRTNSLDFWVLKLDANGNLMWDKTFGGGGRELASSIILTPDGGYAVIGDTESRGYQEKDIWLLKLGSNGNLLWDKIFGGNESDNAYSIALTLDGGFAIAGYTDSKGAGGRDVWVLKLDANGNLLWDKTFGGNSDEWANSIVSTPDGSYIVAGYTDSKGAGGGEFWVLKLDASGNLLWDKTFGGSGDEQAYSVILSPKIVG